MAAFWFGCVHYNLLRHMHIRYAAFSSFFFQSEKSEFLEKKNPPIDYAVLGSEGKRNK